MGWEVYERVEHHRQTTGAMPRNATEEMSLVRPGGDIREEDLGMVGGVGVISFRLHVLHVAMREAHVVEQLNSHSTSSGPHMSLWQKQ